MRRETRDVSGDQETKRRETGFTSHVSRLTPPSPDGHAETRDLPIPRKDKEMKLKIQWKELGKALWAAIKPVLLGAIGGGIVGI